MLLNVHLTNSGNVGDEFCSPSHYFDIPRIGFNDLIPEEVTSFVYGGGAVAAGVMNHNTHNKKSFLWGIGATQRRVFEEPVHPDYKDNILIAGIRDFYVKNKPKTYMWVPCVSCMHPIFDQKFEVTKEVVYYGHAKINPMFDLNNDCMDFENVIKTLASAELVVTSSYHGAYWATLLGKRVICVAFGTKFFGLKHKPMYLRTLPYTVTIFKPERYSDALDECRNANREFYRRLCDTL